MSEVKLTPMMKQYMDIKAEIPDDAVLMFRMGDFYEMFFNDAEKTSQILDITLTKRGGVPMSGIPFHALENYLPRLLEANVKVAIAEQVEDPKTAVGIVKREVARIITPGTVMDSSVLSPKQNNFLISLSYSKGRYGLGCLDISTGDLRVTEISTKDELETELHRLQARECLISESLKKAWEKIDGEQPIISGKMSWTPLQDWIFSFDTADELLRRHFAVASLDGYGCRELQLGVCAAGALLYYAAENLRQNITHVKRLKTYQNNEYMVLDHISQRNLELVTPMPGSSKEGTLLNVLDETTTPMGSRLMREWILRPLYNKDAICERHDSIDALKDDPLTLAELREIIGTIRDLERITARLNVGSATPRDMVALAMSLSIIPDVKYLLSNFDVPLLNKMREGLNESTELVQRINNTINDDPPVKTTEGGLVREGFSELLDELRRGATEGKSWLAEIQRKEQERTGIKTLKIKYNKVFGYYLEVSKSYTDRVPKDYIRKQTLVNAERYITPELKDIESKILGSEDKSKSLEQEIFNELREFALTFTSDIQNTAGALASIDVMTALAECARKYNYTRPHITEDETLHIINGRHPVLDAQMVGDRFVPNDTLLDGDENRMMIITGPNMAGKSTYIRQTAMLVLMAQMGSFIPATSATIGLVDRVFTRVGAADDISRGQSTFMVEMVETANILNHATAKSLVILDEIGRGTSTFDGLSIAWAVAEFLHDSPNSRARTQFATHYHELSELEITKRGVQNYNVAVKEYGDQIIFLRQIVKGCADKSYGIHVAKLAGLPQSVIDRANEVLENLENNAMEEAGRPAIAAHRTAKKRKKVIQVEEPDGPYQASLF